MYADVRASHRKNHLMRILEGICQSLDIPSGRTEEAAQRYEGVAKWLSSGDHPLLRELRLYLQGSIALGTAVKPLAGSEFDVDLVCLILGVRYGIAPAELKRIIGDRLRASPHYVGLLEEMPRCWRLNYANQFHLDITPAITNVRCPNNGELVPDKALRIWKPTNPLGYRRNFERRAKIPLRVRLVKSLDEADRARADVEPYPTEPKPKVALRVFTQVAKRHRDVHVDALGIDPSMAPISVIVTTLISWSYEANARRQFDTEYDAMLCVLRGMTDYIEHRVVDGRMQWFIWNDSTAGENFAEKWNRKGGRAEAFFAWHAKAVEDLMALAAMEGQDRVRRAMDDMFGQHPVGKAFAKLQDDVGRARRTGGLSVAAGIGLAAASTAAATSVRANTFYGT